MHELDEHSLDSIAMNDEPPNFISPNRDHKFTVKCHPCSVSLPKTSADGRAPRSILNNTDDFSDDFPDDNIASDDDI